MPLVRASLLPVLAWIALHSVATDAFRSKPEDWNEELDGEWEPPTTEEWEARYEAPSGAPQRPYHRFVKRSEYERQQQQQQKTPQSAEVQGESRPGMRGQQRARSTGAFSLEQLEEQRRINEELWWPGKEEWEDKQRRSRHNAAGAHGSGDEKMFSSEEEQTKALEQFMSTLPEGEQLELQELRYDQRMLALITMYEEHRKRAQTTGEELESEGKLFRSQEEQTEALERFMRTLPEREQLGLQKMRYDQRMLALIHRYHGHITTRSSRQAEDSNAGPQPGSSSAPAGGETPPGSGESPDRETVPRNKTPASSREGGAAARGKGDKLKTFAGGAALLRQLHKKTKRDPQTDTGARPKRAGKSTDAPPPRTIHIGGDEASAGADDKYVRQVFDPADRRSWRDAPDTVHMWELISGNDMQGLTSILRENPSVVYMRSGDGRGPLWWAYEYGRASMIQLLKDMGAPPDALDANGKRPRDLGPASLRKEEL